MTYEDLLKKLRRTARESAWRWGSARRTQADVADELGISQPAVSKSLNADGMTLRRFVELATAYGLRVELVEEA